MFVADAKNPGQYVLSKSHNLKYEYDSSEGQERGKTASDSPSLIDEIETALEDDVEQEKSDDVRFVENYRFVLVSLIGMVIVGLGGFCLGFTRITLNDTENTANTEKRSYFLSALKGDESVVKKRHKTYANIILNLQQNGSDCVMLDSNQRYQNKKDRDTKYLRLLEANEMNVDKKAFEEKLRDKVLGINWSVIDLSEFEMDDICDAHWDLSKYVDDIREDDIHLKFLPPLDSLRYGEAKTQKLMWLYSNKILEWFQVVMSFNSTLQRAEDLNFVAVRLRFKEFWCYPVLNENGSSDLSKWLIEKRKYEPRVEHIKRLHRHKEYYWKKYWYGVDPAKYELDVDDGIVAYYGWNIFDENENENKAKNRDIEAGKRKSEKINVVRKDSGNLFAQKIEAESKEIDDEDLIRLVAVLEQKIQRNKKLKESEMLTQNIET